MNIFDEDTHQILVKFLDKKVKDAEDEIAAKGILSEEHAIPLLLKTQFNHIVHLESELTELRKLMDLRFEQIDKRFEQIDKRFEQIDKRFGGGITILGVGFAVLGFLIILFGFLK